MKLFDLSFKTPEENLACDEALLDLCENGQGEEILRFWESPVFFTVLGYSNQAAKEIKLETCKTDSVPVLRRASGGGAVLQGPGCLNYALVLQIQASGPFKNLKGSNEFIMETHRDALATAWGQTVAVRGITDLTSNGLKFSGNAQRRKRKYFLFHGTFLYDFDIPRIEKYLGRPSHQPDYRQGRDHQKFLMNLPITAEKIKAALRNIWKADGNIAEVPSEEIQKLVAGKYSRREWNFKY